MRYDIIKTDDYLLAVGDRGKITVGDNILWNEQRYALEEKYKEYIGKIYKLEKPIIGQGVGMIELKDFYPKKSADEVRKNMVDFLERKKVVRTSEQIEESVLKNVETSSSLFLKIGYNISEFDCYKIIAHLPLNNAKPLEGVPLLPELEDNKHVEAVLKGEEWWMQEYSAKERTTLAASCALDGYVKGYKAAGGFTEEDMMNVAKICAYASGNANNYSEEATTKRVKEYIQSLKSIPIAFEAEIICGIKNPCDCSEQNKDCQCSELKIVNNILQGKYIYE